MELSDKCVDPGQTAICSSLGLHCLQCHFILATLGHLAFSLEALVFDGVHEYPQ